MQPVILQIHSSLDKLFSDCPHLSPQTVPLSALWGETVSLQISCRFSPDYFDDYYTCFTAQCPGGDVRVFQAQQVPCSFPCLPSATGDYLFKEPRLVFDPLLEYSGEPVRLNSSYSRIFWVDVFVPVGSSNLTLDITCTSRNGTIQAQTQIPIHVVPTALGPQKVRHTEWFYSDCLCYQYGCTMFSEEFFEIARKYILCAAQHGVDTLLTPVFTPSLDIEHGDRRMPGQLVQITKTESGFSFDFSLLKKWVSVALECGIEWFEIAPFFTQWGAKYAAEIYCNTPNGIETVFGWDTPALDDSYADFLSQFLPCLMQELSRLKIKEKTFFHISDEPSQEHLEHYRKARGMIEPYLEGCPIIDALSSHDFYREGLVSIPVVAEDHLAPFLNQTRTGPIWTYSCCCQDKLVPNIFLSMPSVRARILGVLMYLERLDGFLRWGYNFWNSQFSKKPINPYQVTDSELGFPSGDAFLVYPGDNGCPVPSIRLKLLRDAFQDIRALQILEQQIGRSDTERVIKDFLGEISFTHYSCDSSHFALFRRYINEQISKNLTLEGSQQ